MKRSPDPQKLKRTGSILFLFFLPIMAFGQYPDIDTELCRWAEKKQWYKTGPEVGTFLDSLEYRDSETGKQGRRRRLKNLKHWLESHDCVDKVRIQGGMAKKRPPQKAVEVVFLLMGKENPMTILVVLDKPYSFGGIHETR